MASRVLLAKYGVAFTYPVTLINAATGNFATTADYTQAAGDVQVSKDNGAYANATFNMTAVAGTNGTTWNHVLNATEMQAMFIRVLIADAAPKVILDDEYIIQTYGHASASIITDLSLANIYANVMAIGSNTTAATNLRQGTLGTTTGTVAAASTTTSINTTSLAPAASVIDQFKYKILTFTSDTATAALQGQSTDITGSTALGVLTVTALTTAPAAGDTFTIS